MRTEARPEVVEVTRYEVLAERGERYWVLTVPAVDRVTQARNLTEIEPMARDLISLMLDVPSDSFELDVDLAVPAAVAALVDDANALTNSADRLRHEAGARMRAAAAALHAGGMPMGDVGTVLQVSRQRAQQLVADASDPEWRATSEEPADVAVSSAVQSSAPERAAIKVPRAPSTAKYERRPSNVKTVAKTGSGKKAAARKSARGRKAGKPT